MPLDGRFPHFPGRALGFLYGRGSSTVVLWVDDYTVEEYPGGSATPEDLDAFNDLLDDLRARVRPSNMAVANDAILAAGWEDRGTLKYRVQSGILLADSAALAELADELQHEREEMLADSGGRHPETGSDAWPQWVRVTTLRGATVRGSRALALAAVEALVNELLAAQHPDEYEVWEMKQRKGFRPKLVGLLNLHGADPAETSWFKALDRHSQLRNSMIHHRPEWVVDHRDDQSVAPDDDMTIELLIETLDVVHEAVNGLFSLYGARTPDTHRPEWLIRTAGW